MAFEKYWAEKQRYDEEHQVEMVKVIPANSPMFNKSIFFQSISDIDSMDDNQLINFVTMNFNTILNNVFTGSKTTEYITCFTNVRFLDAFINVLQTQRFYDNDIIVKCNNICYDYISLNSSTKNQMIINRMIMIGNIINRSSIPRLLGLGLSNDLASIISIARYSSFDMNVCVRRVNAIITNQPKEFMTYEVIHGIFEILYCGYEIWIRIFQYFMLDAIPEYNNINDTNTIQSVDEINSIINLVILDILNNMPTTVIRGALINYAENYNIINYGKPVRFSMRRLSDDYYRVSNMVIMLRENENIIIQ